MKTRVEFRSSPYEGEEEQINPCLWGKRLGEYLVQKLADRGIETEEIVAEDCGLVYPGAERRVSARSVLRIPARRRRRVSVLHRPEHSCREEGFQDVRRDSIAHEFG